MEEENKHTDLKIFLRLLNLNLISSVPLPFYFEKRFMLFIVQLGVFSKVTKFHLMQFFDLFILIRKNIQYKKMSEIHV